MSAPRLEGVGAGLSLVAVVCLPLSTAGTEISTGLLLGWSLCSGNLRQRLGDPWVPAALVLAAVWTLSSLASGVAREGIGHAWLLAGLVAFPLGRALRTSTVGLVAASIAGAWAMAQWVAGEPGQAGFSHHLTLAYALLPTLALALHDRAWWAAVPIGLGVLATGSDAAPIAILTTALAVWLATDHRVASRARGAARRHAALVGWSTGAAATLAALYLFADTEELRQRAVLWTGALAVESGVAGAGGYGLATEVPNNTLSPGFFFPHHAHDSLVQLRAVTGMAGVVATLVLVGTVFRQAHPAAAAGLAGVMVGALTQDTLGDLEVARATWAWVAILGTAGHNRGQGSP